MCPIKNGCDAGYMIYKYNNHSNKSNQTRVTDAKEGTEDFHSQSATSDKQSKDLADQETIFHQSLKSAHGTKRHHSKNTNRIDAIGLKRLGKNKAILLNNISLSIPGGALVAVVGASGAGKSTLLNAISGFQLPQKGKVLYGGQDYYRDLSVYRKQVGYVPQDNIVHQNLTVEQALHYAAQMRLPITYTKKSIKLRISEVLNAVDLTPRRHMQISKLSGRSEETSFYCTRVTR